MSDFSDQVTQMAARLRTATHNMGIDHRTAWQTADLIEAQATAIKERDAEIARLTALCDLWVPSSKSQSSTIVKEQTP